MAITNATELQALQALTRGWQVHSNISTSICTVYHTAVKGDNCSSVETQYGITFSQFHTWNPSIGPDCEFLLIGHPYCVAFGNSSSLVQGQCPRLSTILLWFVSLFTISAIWVLLLGSIHLRRYVRKRTKRFPPFEQSFFNSAIGMGGSLILHIGMTILTAEVFSQAQAHAGLQDIAMAWFARPMPAIPAILVALFDLEAFSQNIAEIMLVESVQGLVPVALYWKIAIGMITFDSRAPIYISSNHDYMLGYALLKCGVGICISIWVGILALAVAVMFEPTPSWSHVRTAKGFSKLKSSSKRLLIFFLCAACLRILGGFFLWGGALLLDPSAFCPTLPMMQDVTVIWIFAPVIDHIWRGYFI